MKTTRYNTIKCSNRDEDNKITLMAYLLLTLEIIGTMAFLLTGSISQRNRTMIGNNAITGIAYQNGLMKVLMKCWLKEMEISQWETEILSFVVNLRFCQSTVTVNLYSMHNTICKHLHSIISKEVFFSYISICL